MEPAAAPQLNYTIKVYDAEDKEVHNHQFMMEKINEPGPYKKCYSKAVGRGYAFGLNKITIKIATSINLSSFFQIYESEAVYESRTSALKNPFFRVVLECPTNNPNPTVTLTDKTRLESSIVKLSAVMIEILRTPPKTIVKRPPVIGCHNMFNSGVYKSYLSQLKEFIMGLKEKYPTIYNPDKSSKQIYQYRAISLIELMGNIDLDKPKDFLYIHRKIFNFTRIILAHKNDDDRSPIHTQIMGFVDELCMWIYTKPKIDDECWQLLVSYMPSLAHLSSEKWIDLVPDILFHLVDHEGLSGFEVDYVTDMNLTGNVPAVLWNFDINDVKGKSTTQFIRTPNVAYKNDVGTFSLGYTVVPEFKNFVRWVNSQGFSVLYLNFMATKNNFERQMLESPMSVAIHDLERDLMMPHVHVCSLDRNSRFYLAQQEYADPKVTKDGISETKGDWQNASKFKQEMLRQLFDLLGEMPCVWPDKIGADWQQRCREIIDAVHKHYFSEADYLPEEDRLIMNELVLVYLFNEMIYTLRPDYCFIACQSSVDRGPSFYTLLRILHLMYQKSPIRDDKDIKNILSMLFANAILSHNRAPYHSRIGVFYRAAHMLLSRPPIPLRKV